MFCPQTFHFHFSLRDRNASHLDHDRRKRWSQNFSHLKMYSTVQKQHTFQQKQTLSISAQLCSVHYRLACHVSIPKQQTKQSLLLPPIEMATSIQYSGIASYLSQNPISRLAIRVGSGEGGREGTTGNDSDSQYREERRREREIQLTNDICCLELDFPAMIYPYTGTSTYIPFLVKGNVGSDLICAVVVRVRQQLISLSLVMTAAVATVRNVRRYPDAFYVFINGERRHAFTS